MTSPRHFEVSLKRSGAGRSASLRATLRGLGLTRMGKTIFCKDTPAVRGMLYKVVQFIDMQSHDGLPPPSARQRAKGI